MAPLKMKKNKPILTIAIPTFNRAYYLNETLKQLHQELKFCKKYNVEILISDNASNDNTKTVVAFYKNNINLKYIRNRKNIGGDKNFAQCFNKAKGHYVLLLGDDDIFIDGALLKILKILEDKKSGVICIRPYGFDNDFRSEFPGQTGKIITFDKLNAFLFKINIYMTLISSCVINKHLISDIDASVYCGTFLTQVSLVIEAAKKANQNIYVSSYMIACKRNNSGGFNSRVFVTNLGLILDSYISNGLSVDDIKKIDYKFMLSYYPQYLLRFLLYKNKKNSDARVFEFLDDINYIDFYKRYRKHFCFYFLVYPFFKFPRFLGIIWGFFLVFTGRLINGDFLRGFKFVTNKFKMKFKIHKINSP
jgi:glycosyltransferase involved in cell wall biosynthesis